MAESLAQAERMPADPRLARLRRAAVVPAYNEEASLASVIAQIRAVDPELEIVVVDDGSTDATIRIAREAGVRVLCLPFNLGIGGAVQTGFRYAYENGFDLAMQIDGDGQHDPGELPRLLEPLLAGEADVVIGSRFAGAGNYRAPLPRRLAQRLFASIVSLIAGQRLTDTSSSFRAFNRRALALFSADYPHGFLETVEATALAVKQGLRLKEVPVAMRERELGASSLTLFRTSFYAAKVLVALFVGLFRRSTFHFEEKS